MPEEEPVEGQDRSQRKRMAAKLAAQTYWKEDQEEAIAMAKRCEDHQTMNWNVARDLCTDLRLEVKRDARKPAFIHALKTFREEVLALRQADYDHLQKKPGSRPPPSPVVTRRIRPQNPQDTSSKKRQATRQDTRPQESSEPIPQGSSQPLSSIPEADSTAPSDHDPRAATPPPSSSPMHAQARSTPPPPTQEAMDVDQENLSEAPHTPKASYSLTGLAHQILAALTDIDEAVNSLSDESMAAHATCSSVSGQLQRAMGLVEGWLTAAQASPPPVAKLQPVLKKTMAQVLKDSLPQSGSHQASRSANPPPPQQPLPAWQESCTTLLIPREASFSRTKIDARAFAQELEKHLKVTGNRLLRVSRTPTGGFKVMTKVSETISAVTCGNFGTWDKWVPPTSPTVDVVVERVDKGLKEEEIRSELFSSNETLQNNQDALKQILRLKRRLPDAPPDSPLVPSLSVRLSFTSDVGEAILAQGYVYFDYGTHRVRRYERSAICSGCGKPGHYRSACWNTR